MNKLRLLEADEIECRVGQSGRRQDGTAWCTLLLYKDARSDYRILDETFGAMNWQCHYETVNGSLYCTIEVWDEEKRQWVSKQNVGTKSNTEAEKGEASDAFKRAAVALGIGRELYSAPKALFVNLQPHEFTLDQRTGKVKMKPDTFFVGTIEYDERNRIKELEIVDITGTVRYSMTKSRRPTTKEIAAMTATPPAQPRQVTTDEALVEIQQAQSKQQLLTIFNRYAYLHHDTRFMSALTERKGYVA